MIAHVILVSYLSIWAPLAQIVIHGGATLNGGISVSYEQRATTDCATDTQAAWDALSLPYTPYENATAGTQVGDACASWVPDTPVGALPASL